MRLRSPCIYIAYLPTDSSLSLNSAGSIPRPGHTGGRQVALLSTSTFHLPSPWNSAEADDVQTGPRCVAALPGTVCPFPVHPIAHLPCDFSLTVSGALLTHLLTGKEGEEISEDGARRCLSALVFCSRGASLRTQSPVPWLSISGQTSASLRAGPAVGIAAWRGDIAGLDGRKVNQQESLRW